MSFILMGLSKGITSNLTFYDFVKGSRVKEFNFQTLHGQQFGGVSLSSSLSDV
jgi:hypothetical protein